MGRAVARARLRSTRLPGQGHPCDDRVSGARRPARRRAAQRVFVARPGGEARSARRRQQAARAAPRGGAHCARGVPVRPRRVTRLALLMLWRPVEQKHGDLLDFLAMMRSSRLQWQSSVCALIVRGHSASACTPHSQRCACSRDASCSRAAGSTCAGSPATQCCS